MNIDDLIARASSGNYEIHGNPIKADCLIGFSFGYLIIENIKKPGISNIELAEFIAHNFSYLPKILESIIDEAIKQNNVVFEIKQHRKKGRYLNTIEVALQAKEIMDSHNWHTALIIAHPYHMPRVDAVCQKIGIRTIAPYGLENIRFDPKSKQEWTRDKESWNTKEPKSIIWYAKEGWI